MTIKKTPSRRTARGSFFFGRVNSQVKFYNPNFFAVFDYLIVALCHGRALLPSNFAIWQRLKICCTWIDGGLVCVVKSMVLHKISWSLRSLQITPKNFSSRKISLR